jgi:hypothetical protein
LSNAIYEGIRVRNIGAAPRYHDRWLACATALGKSPSELRNLDYICWNGKTINGTDYSPGR